MKAVNGSFCRLCKKYLNKDAVAAHAKSRPHYDRFVETVALRQQKAKEEEEEKTTKGEAEEEEVSRKVRK